MLSVMKDKKIVQLGFVTNHVEQSAEKFRTMFGFRETPAVRDLGLPEVAKTQYMGQAAPQIACKIMSFNFGNIQFELMEPNMEPSAWRGWLEVHGESLHHVAFFVDDVDAEIKNCEKKGLSLLQRGEFANATGRYAYLDTHGATPYLIELLQRY